MDYNTELRSEIMTQETITSIKLVASDGMVLTNGETYGTEVYLGTSDKPDNWTEITEEEYNELMRKQEEGMEE